MLVSVQFQTSNQSLGNSFGNYTASYELPRKKVKFQIQNDFVQCTRDKIMVQNGSKVLLFNTFGSNCQNT